MTMKLQHKKGTLEVCHSAKPCFVTVVLLDALSNAALVAAAACGIGSVRGYDELVPQTLNVVTEKRLYSIYDGNGKFTKVSIGLTLCRWVKSWYSKCKS